MMLKMPWAEPSLHTDLSSRRVCAALSWKYCTNMTSLVGLVVCALVYHQRIRTFSAAVPVFGAVPAFAKYRLMICVVFVRLHLNFLAISLSGNISPARTVKWTAKITKRNLRSRNHVAGILAFRLEVCCHLGALQLTLV